MDTQIQKTVNKSELEVTLSIILKTLRLNIFYYLFKKDKKKYLRSQQDKFIWKYKKKPVSKQ